MTPGCAILREVKAVDAQLESVTSRLRRAGLDGVVLFALEGLGPFRSVASQLAYIIEPILGKPGGALGDFGRLLEDPARTEELIDLLSQGREAP